MAVSGSTPPIVKVRPFQARLRGGWPLKYSMDVLGQEKGSRVRSTCRLTELMAPQSIFTMDALYFPFGDKACSNVVVWHMPERNADNNISGAKGTANHTAP